MTRPDPRSADPLTLQEVAGETLPTGQSVAAIGALFFATAGVATWASTAPAGLAFALGVGWCLVLRRALRWLDGRTA